MGIKQRNNLCLLRGPYLWWHDFILMCMQVLATDFKAWADSMLQFVCGGEISWKLPTKLFQAITQCRNMFSAYFGTFSSWIFTLSTIHFIASAIQLHYSNNLVK